MGQDEAKKISVEEAIRLIDQLTPAQQEQLRNELNDRVWKQRLKEFLSNDLKQDGPAVWRNLMDRLESSNIDEDFRQAAGWNYVIDRLGALSIMFASGIRSGSAAGLTIDPTELQLEMAYQEVAAALIQVRHATATAIATEKQLELQMQKNNEQAATWQNRSDMARQQNNNELAHQALQRKEQYEQAATELEVQLKAQKEASATLRQRLTEVEGKVQKVYTQKQIIIASDKATKATAKANEAMSVLAPKMEQALSVLARSSEQLVDGASAATVSPATATFDPTQLASEQILIKAALALENATAVIKRLEHLILIREDAGKCSRGTEDNTTESST